MINTSSSVKKYASTSGREVHWNTTVSTISNHIITMEAMATKQGVQLELGSI